MIVGESFPLRVRSKCAAIATASNWGWNFCISFFTSFIVGDIGFKYGYVFAVMCLVLAAVVYVFAKETKGLTLEEIDYMYTHPEIKAWQSAAWARRHLLANSQNSTTQNPAVTDPEKLGGGGKKEVGGSGITHVEDYASTRTTTVPPMFDSAHDDAPTAVNSTNPSVTTTPKISSDIARDY